MPRLLPTRPFLLACCRPLLSLHHAFYRRELAKTAFPLDEPRFEVPGQESDRLVFIGSIAVSGYGVLRHGMKTSNRTAALLASTRQRGVRWSEVTTPTLTISEAASRPGFDAAGADAVVVILGITDVLLGTDPESWALDVALLAARLRDEAGPQCRIVFAGIPPLTEFRPVAQIVDRLMRTQIERLNSASESVIGTLPGADFVAFPTRKVETMFVRGMFSWAALHSVWACALAPVIAAALDERTVADKRTVTDEPAVTDEPRATDDLDSLALST